ncbi:hypothetical protein BDDG_12894, partial [Blastomyces dermatitidis ATCC 18188]
SLSVRFIFIRSQRILYFSRSSLYILSVKLIRRIIDFSIIIIIILPLYSYASGAYDESLRDVKYRSSVGYTGGNTGVETMPR